MEQWSRSAKRTQWLREADNPQLIIINSFACGLHIVWTVISGNNETNCPLVNFIDLLPIIIRVRPWQEEPPDNNKMQIFNHLHRRRDNGHRELQLQWAVVHILDRQIAFGGVRQRAGTGSREERSADEERGGVIE